MLLQQLENEEAVRVAACVYHLRLSQLHMVQTESQYVFLHQCINVSLQSKEDFVHEHTYENRDVYEDPDIYKNRNIYENREMTNANAMVLRSYKTAS
ncbi:hypothetical protein SRHO_G00279740 [Serrasalmus rhombeus]